MKDVKVVLKEIKYRLNLLEQLGYKYFLLSEEEFKNRYIKKYKKKLINLQKEETKEIIKQKREEKLQLILDMWDDYSLDEIAQKLNCTRQNVSGLVISWRKKGINIPIKKRKIIPSKNKKTLVCKLCGQFRKYYGKREKKFCSRNCRNNYFKNLRQTEEYIQNKKLKQRERHQKYYKLNKQQILRTALKWREKNLDKFLKYQREYHKRKQTTNI